MRRLFPIIALLSLIGCSLFSVENNAAYKITVLESPEQTEWSGADFKATSKTGLKATNLDEVNALLNSLQKAGANLDVTWFREGSPSCGNLAVVVPAQLVVKVRGPLSPRVMNNSFEVVTGEPEIFCPNNVNKIEIR